MTEATHPGSRPGPRPLRRGILWGGLVGVALIGVWVLASSVGRRASQDRGTLGSAPKGVVSPRATSTEPGGSVTARVSQDQFHPWPAKPQVIGPPAGMPGAGAAPATSGPAKQVPSVSKSIPEPSAPSSQELAKESHRTGEELLPEDAKAILLDEKKSSAIKLALIDKLRAQNPDEVIPILVAFLEAPASPAGLYTRPTAVKVLSDFKDPLADEALARLFRSSSDERVRLTIAALQAKEKVR